MSTKNKSSQRSCFDCYNCYILQSPSFDVEYPMSLNCSKGHKIKEVTNANGYGHDAYNKDGECKDFKRGKPKNEYY